MKKIIKSYRFPIILLLSMILGSMVGIFFPDSATYLKPFGDIFFYELGYIKLVIPVVRKRTAFNGDCSVRSAALRNTVLIIPVSSGIIPCNPAVLPGPAYVV